MESTLFLFAEYFAWIRLLQERLSFELFESQEARDRFFAAVWEVSEALSLWPDPNIDAEGADVQVFVLQQRAIGELVIRREADAPRVVGYAEFLALRDTDPRFGRVLAPLSSLLEGVEPDTKRWQRLARTREALAGLRVRCDQLLAPPRAA